MPSDDLPSERDPRVVLAAERTLLAWVRTGLAMMGFGFVVARLDLLSNSAALPKHLSLIGGLTFVGIGVLVNALAAVGHARFVDRFNKGMPLRSRPISGGVVVSFVLSLIGVCLMIYLYRSR